MNEKKLRKSPIVIILYILAILGLAYAVYQVGTTAKSVFSYYSQYGVTPSVTETAGYILQAVYQPLTSAILMGAAGYILNEVRALNPAYYATKEELEALKAAKKAAKSGAKLEESIENVEAEPTVVFESVEAADATPEEEALKQAEENL